MGTFNHNWASPVQIISTGDGWITLSAATEQYSSAVDFETSGELGAHVIVEVDFDSTPTDHVDVKLYSSLDGTNWDDSSFRTRRIDKATDPHQVVVPIEGRYAFVRLGVVQSGTTDSHNVRAYVEKFTGETG